MKNKQTAVEWLEDKLSRCITATDRKIVFRKAKAMEKEQIIDAWENGFMSTGEGWNGEIPPDCQGETLDTEEYYNKTYGK